MKAFLLDNYLLIKALHIIAVIAWMAGLLYLPRLFVYHTQTAPGTAEYERFVTMERKLLKIIMNPAMIATWVLGLTLVWLMDYRAGSLAVGKDCAGRRDDRHASALCALGQGFCAGLQHTHGALFPAVERGSRAVNDRDRHLGRRKAILDFVRRIFALPRLQRPKSRYKTFVPH